MYQENNVEKQVNCRIRYSDSEIRDAQAKVSGLFTRVMLRLNPKDENPEIKRLSDLLENFRLQASVRNWSPTSEILENIRNDSRLILKYEWDRVKKGEPVF